MKVFLRLLGVLAVAGGASEARGQFAPPTPADNDAGMSAASPGITIVAPVQPVDASKRTTTPLRATQAFTTNVLMGTISGRPVFAHDLLQPIDDKLKRLADTTTSVEEFRRVAAAMVGSELSNLEGRIVFQAAAEAAMSDGEKQMLEKLLLTKKNDLLAEYGGSATRAEKVLQAQGSSIAKYMEEVRSRYITSFYFGKYIYPRISVTRDMVVARYERDPKEWQQPAQVELFTITLKITKWLHESTQNGETGPEITESTPEQIKYAEAQAMAVAQDLVAKIKGGADFSRLAEDYSDDAWYKTGGRAQGMISKGSLTDATLENYIFSLKANTLGEPQLIRSKDYRDTDVVIVKVGKKQEAHSVTFAQAQDKIFDKLKNEQGEELKNQLLIKLERGATRERVEEMVGVAVDAAVTRYFAK